MNFNDALDCLCSCSLATDLSDASIRRYASDILAEFTLDSHFQPEELVQAYDKLTAREFAACIKRWERRR